MNLIINNMKETCILLAGLLITLVILMSFKKIILQNSVLKSFEFKAVIVIAVLLCGLITFFGGANDTMAVLLPTINKAKTAKVASVKITSPTYNDIVMINKNQHQSAQEIIVQGTYKYTADDLWIVVYPKGAYGKGWPQSRAKKNDGNWTAKAYVEIPDTYSIVVYTATPDASRFLTSFVAKCSLNNSYPGLPKNSMPPGLVEKSKVLVFALMNKQK